MRPSQTRSGVLGYGSPSQSSSIDVIPIPARPLLIRSRAALMMRLASGAWICEPKLDGVRTLAHIGRDGRIHAYSRHGHPLAIPDLASCHVPPNTWLDGETFAGVYWIFDWLTLGGHSGSSIPLAMRHAMLAKSVPPDGTGARLMPRVTLAEAFASREHEGIVLKRLDAGYPRGETTTWLRVRWTMML